MSDTFPPYSATPPIHGSDWCQSKRRDEVIGLTLLAHPCKRKEGLFMLEYENLRKKQQ